MSPRGSLSRRTAQRIMATVLLVTSAMAIGLVRSGLWPVAPFLIGTALLLCFALHAKRPERHGHQHIRVDGNGVTITTGRARRPLVIRRLPLYGLTLERDIDPDFGLRAVRLSLRGNAIEIAGELAPCERAAFADSLETALAGAHCPLWQRNRVLNA